jgi:hypothetical protein
MRRLECTVATIMLFGCGREAPEGPWTPPPGMIVVKDIGFATPESVLHDPELDYYFVSNINGSETEADDNGFISVLTPDGDTLALKGIDGARDNVSLNAPKGMAVAGQTLYVADITVIRRFDRRSGAQGADLVVPGATFLNDVVAADDGSIYFTDSGLRAGASGLEPSGTDAVYRLSLEGKLDTLAMGPELGRPNGIAVSGDSVWVVSYGSGEIYRVANGRKVNARKLRKGGLDGLVLFSGDVFNSSWDARGVYRGKVGGPYAQSFGDLEAPADIGHDLWRNRLLIPLFNANEVRIVPLVELSPTPPLRLPKQ